MEHEALAFAGRLSATPQPCHVECGSNKDLEKLKKWELPTVYLVRNVTIETLLSFRSLVIDCGTKHERVDLSTILLGKDKICLFRGSYRSTKQIARSCRTLLKNAIEENDLNVYFIGISDLLFDSLWDRANRKKNLLIEKEKKSSPAGKAPQPVNRSQLLLHLMPRYDIPKDLIKKFAGNSDEARLVRQMILRAAHQDNPVLILGETGTGKEIVARAIHEQDKSRKGPFTPVNCAAISPMLFESELFGHVKGAFTDAKEKKDGLWKMAGNGTLFLDEIADLSLDHQAKILRALQDQVIHPVGSMEDIRVEAHIIAATNRDFYAMVQAGKFREDLYYRLRSFTIFTPALRNHPDDIPLLARILWKEISKPGKRKLPRAIISELKAAPWYGNVRELKMVLMYLFGIFGTEHLTVNHLRAVYRSQNLEPGELRSLASMESPGFHTAECLRHLKKADEVLRAIKVTLRPVLYGQRKESPGMTEIVRSLQNHVAELEVLCLHPLLFRHVETFDSVRKWNAGFKKLIPLLQRRRVSGIPAYWQANLRAGYKEAQNRIFREAEELMNKS